MAQFFVVLFLIVFTAEFLVEFSLNELNLRYVRARWAERKIPDFFHGKINSEDYDKSVEYTLAKGRFERWDEIYGRVLALIILFSGLLPFLDAFSGNLANRFFPFSEAQGIIFCFLGGFWCFPWPSYRQTFIQHSVSNPILAFTKQPLQFTLPISSRLFCLGSSSACRFFLSSFG